ncbi:MAG: class I SAM-dependent methyltransferase [Anaerolineae bacterium]|nr:class I SAM-dependent methyltransferase [Anaerolineae bacterium]
MTSDIQSSYDRLAAEYARRIAGELDHKPFDRKMLDWLAEKVADRGVICDLGCGPGHVARYLQERESAVCGIDLSAGLIEQARTLNPGIDFEQGDMTALTNIADESFGGIAAFYSIINIARESVPAALSEMRRILKPNGVLLVTFHIGSETRHFDNLWEVPVNLDFHFYETAEIKTSLQTAGFTLEEVIERDPYSPDVEVQTRRAYIFARR